MARRKDHTREEIKAMALAAAVTILETQGRTALTAREISRQIGYTVGTLYNIFNNLNDLILHLNAQTMENMFAVFNSVINDDNTADPKKTVLALTHAYVQFAHNNAPSWQLLFEGRMSGEALPEWYQEKITRLFKLVEQVLLPLFNNSAQDAALAAKTLWASLYGICILSIAGKVKTVLGATAKSLSISLVENYFKGL